MDLEKSRRMMRLARRRAGKTMAQVADELGVRERTLGRWENGETNGWLPYSKELAAAIGITEQALIDGVGIGAALIEPPEPARSLFHPSAALRAQGYGGVPGVAAELAEMRAEMGAMREELTAMRVLLGAALAG